MTYEIHIPLITILLSLVSSIIGVLFRKPDWVKWMTVLSISLIILASAYFLWSFKDNPRSYIIYNLGGYTTPWGNSLRLSVFEVIMVISFGLIILLSIWGGAALVRQEINPRNQALYYVMINVLYASIMAMIYSNDIFTTYVFLEINAMASFGIIVLKANGKTVRATIKYFVMSSIGSGLYLFGVALLYGLTGQLAMNHLSQTIQSLYQTGQYNYPLAVAFVLIFLGLAVKSALYPFHSWLPDAHSSATSTSSAILSAVVLKAYIITSIKYIYYIYPLDFLKDMKILTVIMVFGFIAMIIGSLMAIVQTDFKKMIAYSSVSQVGYIFLGISLATNVGLLAACYHIIAHAITKSGLFLIAGQTIDKVGHNQHKNYYGIGKALPISFGLFTVLGLSMIGIPPSIGFLTKWNLSLALLDSEQNWGLILIVISSLLNAIYFLTISIKAFFMEERIPQNQQSAYQGVEEKLTELYPVMILVAIVVVAGLYSQPIISVLSSAIESFS